MAKAIWNGVVLAESDDVKLVEGNTYFPTDSVKMQYFEPSDRHTTCPWKGEASYYNVAVNGQKKSNLAWYYPNPKPEAANIEGHIAFYPMVKIER